MNDFDSLSDQFELAWRDGNHPSIEAYLDRAIEQDRAQLLTELLQIEFWWRREESPAPHAVEYKQRFSNYSEAVDAAWDAFHARTLGEQNGDSTADDVAATLPAEREQRPSNEKATIGTDVAASVTNPVRYFGEYELLEEIARGGMGVVYKARQVTLNRIVALKMILSGELAGEEEVQRFQTEAEAAANLNHPGIVPIYEIGKHQGQHYFSMGFVEGQSLADRVKDGPLPPREAAEIVNKVAEAVACAP